MEVIERTELWRKSIGSLETDEARQSRERLRAAFAQFRAHVSFLVARIAANLPNLTIHDTSHLDALWETANTIAGEDYPLNPMEAFVFGGAVLLHDAGLCFEAYEGGLGEIRKTSQWRDAYTIEEQRSPNKDIAELEKWSDFAALRDLHSRQASELAERVLDRPRYKATAVFDRRCEFAKTVWQNYRPNSIKSSLDH